MQDKDLRDAIRIANVRQWEVAEAIGISEMSMLKRLRRELPVDKKMRVQEGIRKVLETR